jgi:hypothetical protein
MFLTGAGGVAIQAPSKRNFLSAQLEDGPSEYAPKNFAKENDIEYIPSRFNMGV